MKTSNKFTLMRVLFAPIFFVLYFFPIWTGIGTKVLAAITIPLLVFAEFTDFLDGHFARKHNEVSDFGKMFDPFADVFLHISSFVCFMLPGIQGSAAGGYLPPVLFILIFYREFGMNFLRMAAAKKGVAIAARKGGKFKTVLYIVTEFFTLGVETLLRFGVNLESALPGLKIAIICLFAACVVASYVSFIDYLIHFGKLLSQETK